MIDLHCHILPGVDDGAADVQQSLGMAAQAEADGIELVCATPHIRQDHPVRVEELVGHVAAVNDELARGELRVRLTTGGELAETVVARLTEDELEQASLGGAGRWLLVEPAPGPLAESLLEHVIWLRRVGFRSLIAHPERHYHAGAPALLARLLEHGALVQATAADLASAGGGPALELARQGLVHVVGSDAHSPHVGRPARISDAFGPLAELELLAPHLDWISRAAPEAIVRGEELEAPFGWRLAA